MREVEKMSEISRKEAIMRLEKSAPVCVCASSEFGEFIQGVNKAISDMEKLEKIELMMVNWCENCELLYTEDECNGCSLIKIRQIIKE